MEIAGERTVEGFVGVESHVVRPDGAGFPAECFLVRRQASGIAGAQVVRIDFDDIPGLDIAQGGVAAECSTPSGCSFGRVEQVEDD